MDFKLKEHFVEELFRSILQNKKIFDICQKNLKFEYFQEEVQKKVYKYIIDYYGVQSSVPTIGIIAQNFNNDDKVISLLNQIKKADIPKPEELLTSLQNFIKKSRFVNIFAKTSELYNTGKVEQAISILAKEANEVQNLELKDSLYTRLFADFEERNKNRHLNVDTILSEKCSFGIPELDGMFYGGANKGQCVLVTAASGVGKSTCLRWMAISNSRLGKKGIHFQLEGTEKDCLDAYDAAWTGVELVQIEHGNLTDSKVKELKNTVTKLKGQGGEVFIKSFEQFDSVTIEECREIIIDIIRMYGPIDYVVFDYAELLTVKGKYGNDESSERKRREDIGKKMMNIATEFGITVFTATQAKDIEEKKKNSPDFVLTHNDISEFKGMLKPFAYHITLNQTEDEYQKDMMRIYIDKARKYKIAKRVVRFYMAREVGRFYDAAKTKNLLQRDKIAA